MARYALLPLLLALAAAAAAAATSSRTVAGRLSVDECPLDFMRLPRRVQPSHYTLEVRADPEDKHFRGRVEIELAHDEEFARQDIACRTRTALASPACDRSKIVLSANELLEIESAQYWELDSGLAIPIERLCRSSENELLVVELSRAPSQGSRGKLSFAYTGQVLRDFTGLFRADQLDTRDTTDEHPPHKQGKLRNLMGCFRGSCEQQQQQQAKRKHLLLTQFESAMARKVLPCFDEPSFKATFDLAVERPSHLEALANTRVVREEQTRHEGDERQYTKTYFARTPLMSSYLLAFAVGEFDHVKSTILNGRMTLGMYTPPGRSRDDTKQSLQVAVRGYQALEEFFGVGQPVEKIDFVACAQFPGAMENWGLIAIEESSALPDREDYVAQEMLYSTVTIIHELAHQWFGNLVTLKWWDDLWLNEGFASWISNWLAQELFPQEESDYLYLLRTVSVALKADADEATTHPIKNSALRTVQEIEDSFDQIAYEKSDSVLSMLRSYVGAQPFKAGLRAYIKANQFRNTEDTDLWGALSATSGLDVKELMHSWIHQAGFPLLTAELLAAPPSGATHQQQHKLLVSQMRFPTAAPEADENGDLSPKHHKKGHQKWVVPVSVWVSNGADKLQKVKFVMREARDEIALPSWYDPSAPGHWLKLNADMEGFYRVHYGTPELLAALQAPIETKTMGPRDRLNVLEEVLGLAKVGLVNEAQLDRVLSWFKDEDHHAVVDMVCQILEWLDLKYEGVDQEHYQILIAHFERNGRLSPHTNGPSLLQRYVRQNVLARLVVAGYEPAIREAVELFASSQGRAVPNFIRNPVYGAVARAGSLKDLKLAIKLTKQVPSDSARGFTVGAMWDAVAAAGDAKRERLLRDHFGEE